MEADICERGGGSLQNYSRLLEDTLYRTMQTNTEMKSARKVILACQIQILRSR